MNVQFRKVDARPGETEDRSFCFLLLPGFSLLSLACAVETLDNANNVLGGRFFEWSTGSVDGKPVQCGSGTSYSVEGDLAAFAARTTIIVVGGDRAAGTDRAELRTWLRHHAAFGSRIGALGAGVFALAAAGLLERRCATTPWPSIDSFEESFPEVEVSRSLVVDASDRFSCSGGVATIEMMLAIIARRVSVEAAEEIARSSGYSPIRRLIQNMNQDHTWRFDVRDPKLRAAIGILERNIEQPITAAQVAAEVGISVRQMERIFKRELGISPKRLLQKMRLARARALLLETNMKVTEVQVACGFQSHSQFSRRFKNHYGTSPRVLRSRP